MAIDRAELAQMSQFANQHTYEVNVPAKTLSSLIDKHGLTNIDLLSLDLEGHEFQALGCFFDETLSRTSNRRT